MKLCELKNLSRFRKSLEMVPKLRGGERLAELRKCIPRKWARFVEESRADS